MSMSPIFSANANALICLLGPPGASSLCPMRSSAPRRTSSLRCAMPTYLMPLSRDLEGPLPVLRHSRDPCSGWQSWAALLLCNALVF